MIHPNPFLVSDKGSRNIFLAVFWVPKVADGTSLFITRILLSRDLPFCQVPILDAAANIQVLFPLRLGTRLNHSILDCLVATAHTNEPRPGEHAAVHIVSTIISVYAESGAGCISLTTCATSTVTLPVTGF